MDWNPSADVARVISQVQGVLREYGSYGPMTVRQIFYRLVGQHGYPKDERAYKRLAEYLVKARRSQMIGFHQIRDDGTVVHSAPSGNTREDVWAYIRDIVRRPADYLRLDRNEGQPYHIELWCEAAGMAPMLSQMTRYRDVSVYSTGGFSSVTVTHEVAQRVASREKPTYFLHVGDYDPSGESIFTSMSQDIGAFVSSVEGLMWKSDTGETQQARMGYQFIPHRVALTEDQVDEYDLPSAPPKLSDSRSSKWVGETTQAEAMPPNLLEQVVRAEIDNLTDEDALQDVLEQEKEDKERLRASVEDQSVSEIIEEARLTDPSLLDVVKAIETFDLDH